jgi:hypothetical protein
MNGLKKRYCTNTLKESQSTAELPFIPIFGSFLNTFSRIEKREKKKKK